MAPKKSRQDSRSVSRSRSRSRERRSSKKSSRHRSSHKRHHRHYSSSSSSSRSRSRDRRSRSRSRSPKRYHSSRSSRHHGRSDSRDHKYSKSYTPSSQNSATTSPRSYQNHYNSNEFQHQSHLPNYDGAPLPPPNLTHEEASAAAEEEDEPSPQLPFKNDGSFLEMFKKMSDTKPVAPESDSNNPPKPASSGAAVAPKPGNLFSFVGKRKGGKVLPTGKVEKVKKPTDDEEDTSKKDAWSQYMTEVRKYKERNCQEERQNRPLVK